MKAKKALVYKSVFPSLPKSVHSEYIIISGVAHQIVIKDIIYKVFMTQSISKTLEPNKINF